MSSTGDSSIAKYLTNFFAGHESAEVEPSRWSTLTPWFDHHQYDMEDSCAQVETQSSIEVKRFQKYSMTRLRVARMQHHRYDWFFVRSLQSFDSRGAKHKEVTRSFPTCVYEFLLSLYFASRFPVTPRALEKRKTVGKLDLRNFLN
jgi:hypothetical protein